MIGPAGDRSQIEQLVQRHGALEDVAAGQAKGPFEVDRREDLVVEDRIGHVGRVAGNLVQAAVQQCLSGRVIPWAVGELVRSVLDEQ